jgi:hypothetical protein
MVYHDGKLTQQIDLQSDKVVEGIAGNPQMDVEVSGGRIRISRTNCPHGTCKHAGWISREGETLVCLPNKTLIEIVGDSGDTKYNAVSY